MEIHRKVPGHIGKYDTMLEIVKKRKVRWFGHVVRVNGTLTHNISQGNAEGNFKITSKASKTMVEWCKGMYSAELEWDVEGARGQCGMEKMCQSCCPNGMYGLWESRSRLKKNNVSHVNEIKSLEGYFRRINLGWPTSVGDERTGRYQLYRPVDPPRGTASALGARPHGGWSWQRLLGTGVPRTRGSVQHGA